MNRDGRQRALALLAPVTGLLVLLAVLLTGTTDVRADATCSVPPINLTSALGEDNASVVLTWEASPDCTPDAYAVYRRDMDVAGARMVKIDSVDGGVLSYSDSTVGAGQDYRYRIRSNDQGPRSGRTDITIPEATTTQLGQDTAQPTTRDTDAPALSMATVVGASLVLTYDETLDSDSTPLASAYSVTVAGTSAAPSSVSISGSAVTLTLATAVIAGQTVTVSYTVPTGMDAMPVQDEAGNAAAALSSQSVTNNTANSAPSFNAGHPATLSVNENTASGESIGNPFTATDDDTDDTLTYWLTGDDASSFSIVSTSGQIQTSAALNFEAKSSYSVTVNVRDSKDADGNADTVADDTHDVTINVNNVDEAGTVTLPGTITAGQAVTATLTDPDGTTSSETWQWSRSDTAGGTFTPISGATSNPYTPGAADVGKYLKATASYTDPQGSGKSATSAASGQVAAGNVDPSFSSMTATRSVPENTAANTNVGAPVSTTDDDGDTLEYRLTGTDAGSFSLDMGSGQIKTSATLNFESKSNYSVVVEVRDKKDSSGASDTAWDDTIAVTINLGNLDEPGTVTIMGTEAGGETLTASLTDLDGTPSNVTWQWARAASASGPFMTIGGATSNTYATVALDVNRFVRAMASYADPQGSGKSANAVTGQISASNAEPQFPASETGSRSVPENSPVGTAVGDPVEAEDDDGDALHYSLSGSDASSFTIDSGTGQIRTKMGVTYNFEGTAFFAFSVDVRDSKDAAGNADMATDDTINVTVTLSNVNEAPEIKTTQTMEPVAENTPATTVIITFAAEDVDASTTFSWSVETADDGDKFDINSDGELTFKTSPNFEEPTDDGMDNVYNLTVKVTDNGSPAMSDTHAFAVTVTNINEAPEITSTGGSHTMPTFDENATGVIATYTAEDVDAGSVLTWSVEGNDAGDFNITKNAAGDGELSFKTPPDYREPRRRRHDERLRHHGEGQGQPRRQPRGHARRRGPRSTT